MNQQLKTCGNDSRSSSSSSSSRKKQSYFLAASASYFWGGSNSMMSRLPEDCVNELAGKSALSPAADEQRTSSQLSRGNTPSCQERLSPTTAR
jgi:hypothetical protein